jgi:pyruvate kinase
VALSFVQRPEDIVEVRALVGDRVGIVAKLEKPAAIDRLDEIVAVTDAVMVARGDLGVEMPAEQVPSIQKRIIHACRRTGKPVIVATQMLESMVTAPVPTRAEASDVATAIYEGADAVMLSAESASGRYPVEAVRIMSRIIAHTEHDPAYRKSIDASRSPPRALAADAIGQAAQQVAALLQAVCTVAYTTSGYSALRLARERPWAPIIGMASRVEAARRLALVWGVHAVVSGEVGNVTEMTEAARRTVADEGFGQPGNTIVISAGMPFSTAGTTNLLRIAQV